jgi:hypothetical protein
MDTVRRKAIMHDKKILIVKRMVQDLLHLYGNGPEALEAMDRLRDLIERGVGNPDIPLEWYEFSDDAFLRWVRAR